MAIVVFVPHLGRDGALALARQSADWLSDLGHEARVIVDSAEGQVAEAIEGADLAVSLGGDGSMLHTIALVLDKQVPVLGVNFGRLGYLTVVERDDLPDALQRWLDGSFEVESRMVLEVSIISGRTGRPCFESKAINDVIVTRPSGAHTVHVELSISDQRFLSYAADSMIVATPTGSTAYNLSARGPIVSPQVRATIITPVAPHMLFDRSLVLAEQEVTSIELLDGRPAEIVIDGTLRAHLDTGDHLVCKPSAHDAHLVTFGGARYQGILKRKFNLTDR